MTNTTVRANIHAYFDESLQYIADVTNSTKSHIFYRAIVCFCIWKLSDLEQQITNERKRLRKLIENYNHLDDVDLSTYAEVEQLKKINRSWIGKNQDPRDFKSEMIGIETPISTELYELLCFIAKSIGRDEERCVNEAIFNYVLEKIEDFEDCEKLLD
jgi:predicted transcriptional regulator